MDNNNSHTKNIFEQFSLALTSPTKYKELVKLPVRRFILFVFVIISFITLITVIIPTSVIIANFGGFTNLFQNGFPEFSYDGQKLESSDILDMNMSGIRVYMDTSKESLDEDIVGKNDYMVFSLGSNICNVYLNTGEEVVKYMTGNYDDLLSQGFNNQSLVEASGLIYFYIGVVVIINAVFFFGKYAVIALLLAIIVNPINKKQKLGFSFGQMFMMGFYAQTIGILLVNINIATGAYIPTLIVSCIGLFVASRFIMNAVISQIEDSGNGGNKIFN